MNWTAVLAFLSGAILYATPLLFATLGEVIGQRAGLVNLGLEGIMLIGASVSFAVGVHTGNAGVGLLAAMAVGIMFNLLYGFLVITRRAPQLASGLAMMFFGLGLSALIGKAFVGQGTAGLPTFQLPGLALLGRTVFNYDPLVYIVFPLAVVVWWALFRARWGLSLRAVGESPATAYAAGLSPVFLRYQAVILGGLLGSLAGAHLSLGVARTWSEMMTAGRGWVAIALVIFAKWHPLRAMFGAILFGGAVTLQLQAQVWGIGVSPFLLDMLPYLLTLVVLLLWGGARRHAAPGSLGRVYRGTE
jgi:simple sugar transport system permease protein